MHAPLAKIIETAVERSGTQAKAMLALHLVEGSDQLAEQAAVRILLGFDHVGREMHSGDQNLFRSTSSRAEQRCQQQSAKHSLSTPRHIDLVDN